MRKSDSIKREYEINEEDLIELLELKGIKIVYFSRISGGSEGGTRSWRIHTEEYHVQEE